MKTTDEIKTMFLNFFKKHGHKVVKESSIVPKKDKTLLFTNAGMNQFKDYFLEKKKSKYNKIVTLQKCIRTGGKEDDINKVGVTNHHHTFFEMLGNFSFGGYSKKQAILYAWTLLTSKKYFALNKNKIIVTVNYEDIETYEIWLKVIKLNKKNIIITEKNSSKNFWQMGETGPCGPSTEIFYKKYINKKNNFDKEILEIWNIVFVQYNNTGIKKLTKLKNIYVDTGMGLERIASILQKVNSTYEIDIFKKIKKKIIQISNSKKKFKKSINIILDHIRTVSFIISENITPANEYHGYILKKIIRRIILHGKKLCIKNPFLHILVPEVIKIYKSYKKLKIYQNKIVKILQEEEEMFKITLNKGIKYLKKKIKNKKIDAETVFYLYDTLGLPIDITKNICKKNNIKINEDKLFKIINKKKIYNKSINIFKKKYNSYISPIKKTKFFGYKFKKITSTILYIYKNKKQENKIFYPDEAIIILKETTFYGESAGQIGDSGIIYNKHATFLVENTTKIHNMTLHQGKVIKGSFKKKEKIISKIDYKKRLSIQANHTSTHLLHKTLKIYLDNKITQQGSNIKEKYFTFDFSYIKKISNNEIYKIEKKINKEIQKNHTIKTETIEANEYNKIHKKKLLIEKGYKNIRIVKIGNFSSELCSGTHVKSTGEIGIFKIFKIYKISSKKYRIRAATRNFAFKKMYKNEKIIKKISKLIKIKNTKILSYINLILARNKSLNNTITLLKEKLLNKKVKKMFSNVIKIKKYNIVIETFHNEERKLLIKYIDKLRNEKQEIIIILANIKKNNISILIGVTKKLSEKINATKILYQINKVTEGRGGGKNTLAEGGSSKIKLTEKMLKNIKEWFPYK
ncbi:alanine--tRNA ligase [Buchnera aphidicola (Chaitoregma tattakana)]|uniref:alanine--tRNA ligase n=1 Tax=Buchnera aphidicola TaxID=9 RepID=UPI0031B82515